MAALLYISLYGSVLCFVFGCLRRVRQYASLPLHLRWELYPVPHEPPERAKHGGSFFEERDWWTRPRRLNYAGELREMFAEILLFRSVQKTNPTLWWRSLLFHSGLYCIVTAGLLHLLAIVSHVPTIAIFAAALGSAGLSVAIVGAIALVWRRVSDRTSRDYTHAADYLHLGFISLTAILLFAGTAYPVEPNIGTVLRGAMTFDTELRFPPILAAGLMLACALLAYIPFSKMAHFIAKYFTFHSIRWDDEPNRGGRFAKQVGASLACRPTWSATHINADGQKTWADIATDNPTTEARK
jgi:nitrate reductase gamma subunit